MTSELKHTPLYAEHLRRNARMVDFAGWEMPVMYGGILEEARAVRSRVGIFDISHMGRITLTGKGATACLQSLTSNDVSKLTSGAAQYSLLTNPNGGIIDDIIIYREGEEAYLVVINASNSAKDITWIEAHLPPTVTLTDNTLATAMIAVQGPEASALVSELAANSALLTLPRFGWTTSDVLNLPVTFCRTGYTGEDGFEMIMPSEIAGQVWDALVVGGAAPCGLGSRDALRIEAGYPLYGHEIDDTTSPVEAGLMWAVKLDKGPFTGSAKIAEIKKNGAKKRLVGLLSEERTVPRQGYNIFSGADVIGTVTSGVFSPILNRSIAMAYIASEFAAPGTVVEAEIRGKRTATTVTPKKDLLKR